MTGNKQRERDGKHMQQIAGSRHVAVHGLCLKPLGHQGPADEIKVSATKCPLTAYFICFPCKDFVAVCTSKIRSKTGTAKQSLHCFFWSDPSNVVIKHL